MDTGVGGVERGRGAENGIGDCHWVEYSGDFTVGR
jgi:hypothetical protein